MNRVRKLVGAARAYEQGVYGAGIGVAVLDSGINGRHPDLRGRLVYSYNYFTHSAGGEDDCGHGTHIGGIVGGTGEASGGRYQGLAPRCHFLSLKVLDREGNGNSSLLMQALYWLIDHRREYDVRIVNISAGSAEIAGKRRSGLLTAVEEAWDAGLLVCAAAGNQGPARSSITVPGTSPKIITVGSSDDNRAVRFRGGWKVNYSGRGPTLSSVCKPDVTAPGAYIRSCSAEFEKADRSLYTEKSGTSMATPVAAGSFALLLSRERELTNRQVKEKLRTSCRDLGYPRNRQGWGQIWIPGLLE